jgi:hypothetical protein
MVPDFNQPGRGGCPDSTTVELAAVCGLAAVLSAIAIPSMMNAAWNFTAKRPTPGARQTKAINRAVCIFRPWAIQSLLNRDAVYLV